MRLSPLRQNFLWWQESHPSEEAKTTYNCLKLSVSSVHISLTMSGAVAKPCQSHERSSQLQYWIITCLQPSGDKQESRYFICLRAHWANSWGADPHSGAVSLGLRSAEKLLAPEVQCFSFSELQRISKTLGIKPSGTQLVDDNIHVKNERMHAHKFSCVFLFFQLQLNFKDKHIHGPAFIPWPLVHLPSWAFLVIHMHSRVLGVPCLKDFLLQSVPQLNKQIEV